MLTFLILIAVLALAAFVLHYGYKLAFYYTDPNASPYAYGTDEQITAFLCIEQTVSHSFTAFKGYQTALPNLTLRPLSRFRSKAGTA